jgi:succinylarginine dihydrolase
MSVHRIALTRHCTALPRATSAMPLAGCTVGTNGAAGTNRAAGNDGAAGNDCIVVGAGSSRPQRPHRRATFASPGNDFVEGGKTPPLRR